MPSQRKGVHTLGDCFEDAEPMTTETSPAAQTGGAAAGRVFLVVVDDTTEWRAALRFACRRARHTGGRVALLHVVEPSDVPHWMTVEEVMREERRQGAEQLRSEEAKAELQSTI